MNASPESPAGWRARAHALSAFLNAAGTYAQHLFTATGILLSDYLLEKPKREETAKIPFFKSDRLSAQMTLVIEHQASPDVHLANATDQTTNADVLWTKEPCGQVNFQPRIINGLRVPENRYPWVVLVQARDDVLRLTGICGGTLITHKHVLTAGHCLFLKGKRSKLFVLYGHTTLALAQRVAVHRAVLHPSYDDQTLANDIALLLLSRKVEFTEHVQPACLPTESFPPLPGAIGIVAGWGYTSDSDKKQHQNPYLLFATQTVMSTDFCIAKMQGYYYSPSTTFCAYRHGYDACQGDSGGSLMTMHNDRWYSVGIISYGVGCATPGVPGIYTDVTKYIPWLRHHLKLKRQTRQSLPTVKV